MKYGTIPAGGLGTRLQPIGFSKELVPVHGRAVIEYLLARMCEARIDKIFVNTAPDKTDLIKYLAEKSEYRDKLIFLVRERKGLLDGIVLPESYLSETDELYFGLPDTIWYPTDGFAQLDKQAGDLVLGLFDTGTPKRFDSVTTNDTNQIQSIKVKSDKPQSDWTWGIGKMSVKVARELRIYEKMLGDKPLFGEAMNLYCQDHPGFAHKLEGSSYLDIGIPEDYQRADSFVTSHE